MLIVFNQSDSDSDSNGNPIEKASSSPISSPTVSNVNFHRHMHSVQRRKSIYDQRTMVQWSWHNCYSFMAVRKKETHSSYPTNPHESNELTVNWMNNLFEITATHYHLLRSDSIRFPIDCAANASHCKMKEHHWSQQLQRPHNEEYRYKKTTSNNNKKTSSRNFEV